MTLGTSPKPSAPEYGRSWSGLLQQLFFFFILPLAILLIVVTFGSQALHDQAMRSMVGVRDERAVRTAVGAIEGRVRQRTNLLSLLALQAAPGAPGGSEGAHAQADFLDEQFDAGLAFVELEGDTLRVVEGAGTLRFQADDLLESIQQLLQSGDAYRMSDALTHSTSGEPLLVILVPTPETQRVVVGAFSVASLVEPPLANALVGEHGAYYLLVDGSGRLINSAGSSHSLTVVVEHPGVSQVLKGESGTAYVQVGESEHVVVYNAIPLLGWGLVSAEPWEMVSTPVLRNTQLAPLILVPFSLLMLVALWFGARQIVGPLRILEERAARLAAGDFKSIEAPIEGLAEIRQLNAELVHMAHEVQAAQQSLHDYVGSITAAQEDERRRLARELHDDTIQSLIALKQRAQLLRLDFQARLSSPEVAKLDELSMLAEQTIENLRRLTRALRPIYLEDLGLTTALEMLAGEVSQTAGIPVEFRQIGSQRRLEDPAELMIYRMVQEALSNVARHARAQQASVEIEFAEQFVSVKVEDDGRGFSISHSPAEFARQGHFGLVGLDERADLIGARLDIASTPGKGTRINILLDTAPDTQADSHDKSTFPV